MLCGIAIITAIIHHFSIDCIGHTSYTIYMDRYYSPVTDRNEDGSYSVAVQYCENCGTTGSFDSILTDDGEQLLLCDDCIDEQRRLEAQACELAAKPGCELRGRIVQHAASVGQLVNGLRAHDMQCAACGCPKRTVENDRLWLNAPDAVCCEGKVA